jgi:hypothetical protein
MRIGFIWLRTQWLTVVNSHGSMRSIRDGEYLEQYYSWWCVYLPLDFKGLTKR